MSFEKLTEMDYRGTTYYTIRNLSLYECQGWCREEPDCAAAAFRSVFCFCFHYKHNSNYAMRDEKFLNFLMVYYSFVVNPLAPVQETVCLLQNDTTGSSPTVNPQKAVSTYYMIKLNVRSGKNQIKLFLLFFLLLLLFLFFKFQTVLPRCNTAN